MPQIALITAAAARGLDEDMAPLQAALRSRGIEHSVVDWDDQQADWAQFDLAIVRSTWDYTRRLKEFLSWAQRTAQLTRLVNPFPVLKWNTDKHYLHDLELRGCPIVPASFVELGDTPRAALAVFLLKYDDPEFVVKPAVSGGSRDTQRYRRTDLLVAEAHIAQLIAAGRTVVLQPYLPSVDTEGETALIYFRGEFSHAIRKGPLLRLDSEPTRALFAAEHIRTRTPAADELACGREVLGVLPIGPPLYARIDVIRDRAGAPRVLEVELTEPSLFFNEVPGSAARFADAAIKLLAAFTPPEL